jgi:hypothetical protein
MDAKELLETPDALLEWLREIDPSVEFKRKEGFPWSECCPVSTMLGQKSGERWVVAGSLVYPIQNALTRSFHAQDWLKDFVNGVDYVTDRAGVFPITAAEALRILDKLVNDGR